MICPAEGTVAAFLLCTAARTRRLHGICSSLSFSNHEDFDDVISGFISFKRYIIISIIIIG